MSPDDEALLLWTLIDTSELQLRVDEYFTSLSCIGIDLYGCVYSNEGLYNNISS